MAVWRADCTRFTRLAGHKEVSHGNGAWEQLLGKSRSMIFLAELALGYARVARGADARRLRRDSGDRCASSHRRRFLRDGRRSRRRLRRGD